MAAGPDSLLHYIRRLVTRRKGNEDTDAALLGRFITYRDETAFAALVDRHGPLVLNVCRRVLGDIHDAEDAFQATFLVLARKASTIRPRGTLPAWLHVVARRVALKARSAKARQLRDARPLNAPPADPRLDPLSELTVRELLTILDEEVQRLPETYRLPLILCCLEGRSLEDAAQQLGWTVGSVKGRLERGRARLRAHLVRRGATLTAALAAAEASRDAASAAVVARMLSGTVRIAVAFAARQPLAADGTSSASALAGETLKSMAVARLKFAAALLFVATLLTAGVIVLQPSPKPDQSAQARSAPLADSPAGRLPGDPDAPIHVSGRVLDPNDRPIAGARLYVGFSAQLPVPEDRSRPIAYSLRTRSGTDGQFRFTFTQSELDAVWLDHSRPVVIAVAQDFGPAWAMVTGSPSDSQLSLKLARDFPIEGRILGTDQKPAAGARVRVWEVADGSEGDFAQVFRGEGCVAGKGCRGPLPEQLPFLTTTADGRFRLTGLGRDRIVTLLTEVPDVCPNFVFAATRPRPDARSLEQLSLASFDYRSPVSRRIRARVRDKATGQPVAGVKVSARRNSGGLFFPSLTDKAGDYEVLVWPQVPGELARVPKGWIVRAQPEGGQPYFAASVFVPDHPGSSALGASTLVLLASPQGQGSFLAASALFPGRADNSATDAVVVDLDLVSGIRLRGRVVDQATGKPPKRAMVEYYPLFPNPHSSEITRDPEAAASSCVVQPDGSYSLAVLPGPGVVCVAASPRDWYAAANLEEREFSAVLGDRATPYGGGPVGTAVGAGKQKFLSVHGYHILSLINAGEGGKLPALDLNLRRVQPSTGTAIGPNGQ